MQQQQGSRPTDFPFDFPYLIKEYAHRTIVMADFDVVGACGPRLRRLVKLSKENKFILKTHAHWVPGLMKNEYQKNMELFQQQFPTVKVEASEAVYRDMFLDRLLQQFPHSMKMIGDYSEKFLDDYFRDHPPVHWLIEDHFSWWPLYVKERFHKSDLAEVVMYEWILAKLDFMDLPLYRKADPGQIYLNPTLQVLKMEAGAKALGKSPGIWIFYRQGDESQTLEMLLDPKVAQVLDVLGEDRKFSLGQLTDYLQQESEFLTLTPVETLHLLQRLLRDSLLIQKNDLC